MTDFTPAFQRRDKPIAFLSGKMTKRVYTDAFRLLAFFYWAIDGLGLTSTLKKLEKKSLDILNTHLSSSVSLLYTVIHNDESW